MEQLPDKDLKSIPDKHKLMKNGELTNCLLTIHKHH